MCAVDKDNPLLEQAEIRDDAGWMKRRRLHLDPDRTREWCKRNIPHLSRPWFKFGRDYPLGLVFGLLAVSSVGRWWEWFHGTGPLGTVVMWTAIAMVPLVLARRRWLVASVPLGWIGVQSLFHFVLERETVYLLTAIVCIAATVLLCTGQALRDSQRRSG